MTPRLLSPEELAEAGGGELRAHIAALEADSAALVRGVMAFYAAWKSGRDTLALVDLLRIAKASHPGIALLSEHAKALETRGAEIAGLLATLKHERSERAKALVRARNGGLERAALAVLPAWGEAAAMKIRAMKETEE